MIPVARLDGPLEAGAVEVRESTTLTELVLRPVADAPSWLAVVAALALLAGLASLAGSYLARGRGWRPGLSGARVLAVVSGVAGIVLVLLVGRVEGLAVSSGALVVLALPGILWASSRIALGAGSRPAGARVDWYGDDVT